MRSAKGKTAIGVVTNRRNLCDKWECISI